MIVKRLVCIEDLGNIRVLFTDKTGTLTDGAIRFADALGPDGSKCGRVFDLGLACSDRAGNELDRHCGMRRRPTRRHVANARSVAVRSRTPDRVGGGAARAINCCVVTKGAPERVLSRCDDIPDESQAVLTGLFQSGTRVVAVASRPASRAPHAG